VDATLPADAAEPPGRGGQTSGILRRHARGQRAVAGDDRTGAPGRTARRQAPPEQSSSDRPERACLGVPRPDTDSPAPRTGRADLPRRNARRRTMRGAGRQGRAQRGRLESRRQRDQVLGRAGAGRGRTGTGQRDHDHAERARPGDWHRRARAEADLQALLPGSRRHDAGAYQRHRPRTLHRPLGRRAPRRESLRGKRRAGTRQHVRGAATPDRAMSRILIVEDEQHLADGLRYNLEVERHDVAVVDTGEEALVRIDAEPTRYELVILDVMLPGIDGFGVVAALRRQRRFVPVLMLTARGRSEDVLRGFDAGADDYLPKPFELPILLSRGRGLLRRHEWVWQVATEARSTVATLSLSSAKTIDFAQLEVLTGDRRLSLTLMEAALLRYLVEHEGTPVSRAAILEHVWGLRDDTDTRAIDNFIVRLRRYIEDEPTSPRHVQTVRGLGYRFVANPK